MKERHPRLFKPTRKVERILDILSEDPTISNDELDRKINRKSQSRKLGDAAEKKGIEVLSTLNEVRMVIKASPEEDAKKIDLWVYLKKDFYKDYKFKKIPVQIKSSEWFISRVQTELAQHEEQFGKAPIIVLNCGKKVSDKQIISDFIQKVKLQIGVILTKKPQID